MRPMNEVARAILHTANTLSAAGRGVTLAELAAGANVGQQAARHTVSNLRRAGALEIIGERRVDYRNRPVAEYAPALPVQAEAVPDASPEAAPDKPGQALGACMLIWLD